MKKNGVIKRPKSIIIMGIYNLIHNAFFPIYKEVFVSISQSLWPSLCLYITIIITKSLSLTDLYMRCRYVIYNIRWRQSLCPTLDYLGLLVTFRIKIISRKSLSLSYNLESRSKWQRRCHCLTSRIQIMMTKSLSLSLKDLSIISSSGNSDLIIV